MPANGLAVYSAKVYTGLPHAPWAEAVGVKDGRIAALGSNSQIKAALPLARDLDLAGCLVAPGLVDAHCHFIGLGLSLLMVDLRNLDSLAACRAKIQEAAAQLKPGQWLLGRNWNQNLWQEGREPLKSDLDDLVPHNPAVMRRVCTHSDWVNSKALEILGIHADTPDPPGGQYDRDGSGQPTGMLREAMKIVDRCIPAPDLEQRKEAALAAQSLALKSGLTGVHTCESLNEWHAFRELEKEGKLKLRVHHLLQSDDLEQAEAIGLRPGRGSDRLWVGHLKLFADGSLGTGTALLCEDYSDEPGCCGIPFLEAPELNDKVAQGYQRGYSVAVHAIGDLAGKNALDAIARARRLYPGPRRDRIEHVQLHCREDLARYRELEVAASVQPAFVATDWAVAQRRWGERCQERGYTWKTFLDQKIRVQFGSDAPVEMIQPVYGLQAAVLRQDTNLQPPGGWQPQERLSLEQSLSGYSATAAWSSNKEDRLGSLKPGNWADTVFEKDLSQVEPGDWPQVKTALTMIGGDIVFTQ